MTLFSMLFTSLHFIICIVPELLEVSSIGYAARDRGSYMGLYKRTEQTNFGQPVFLQDRGDYKLFKAQTHGKEISV